MKDRRRDSSLDLDMFGLNCRATRAASERGRRASEEGRQ